MILHFLCISTARTFAETNAQICACAEDAAGTGYDDAFYARVDVEHGVGGFELFAHRVGEGIMIGRAVEREDNDRRLFLVVPCLDLCEFEVVVGGGKGDVGLVARGLGRHGGLLEC
jgi:hypothetical protein